MYQKVKNCLRRNVLLLAISILILFVFTIPFLFVSAQSSQYVVGTVFYAPADVPIPQKGVTFNDPDFDTTLVRITDKTDGYSGAGIQNEYARTDPENSDGTYVILRGNDGEWYLYDAVTFQMKKHFTSLIDGIEPEPRWDASNPNLFYYLYLTELRTYNVDTDVSATVHDFKKEFPSATYVTTGVEGDASLNQRFWSFMIKDFEYNLISAIVFDKESDSIVGQKTDFPDDLDWISMSMSGSHCVVGYDTHFAQVFSRDFSSVIDLPLGANGHMDLVQTSDGKDVMVYQNTQTDWIAMADLDTGTETPLVFIPFEINSDIGLHFSGNCAEKPGWVLVSTYGAKNPPPNRNHSWMDTQLFMVELKQDPVVWRIAHTQCYIAEEYSGEDNYFAEAFATINKAGSRIYFGSNWEDYTVDFEGNAYTDTYQVVLPTKWSAVVPELRAHVPTPSASVTPTPTVSPIDSQTPEPRPREDQLIAFIAIGVVITLVAVGAIVFKLKKKRAL
jgi:hypothetical protein